MDSRIKGFKLAEVAIIILVVSALAAILVPVMSKLGAKAKQNSCSDNMHQLTMALNQYVNDNDQTYPYAVFDGDTFGKGNKSTEYSWAYAIKPYVKGQNAKAFVCPMANTPAIEHDFTTSGRDVPRTYFPILQFADNLGAEGSAIILDSWRTNGAKQDKVTAATIMDTANTAWLVEAGPGADGRTSYTSVEHGEYTGNRQDVKTGGPRANQIGRWHNGSSTFAMADGHVKCVSVEDSINLVDRHNDWWARKK